MLARAFHSDRFRAAHHWFHTHVEPLVPHLLMDLATDVYEALGGREWFITSTDGIKPWLGSKHSADEETARVNPSVLRRPYGRRR